MLLTVILISYQSGYPHVLAKRLFSPKKQMNRVGLLKEISQYNSVGNRLGGGASLCPLTPPSMRVRTRRFASFDEVWSTFELNSSALGIASRLFRGLYANEVI